MFRFTQRFVAVAICVAFVGCGDKGGEKAPEATGETAAPAKAPEAAKKPFAEMFQSKAVALPGALAKVPLGMAKAEAEKALPGLFGMGVKSAVFADVELTAYDEDGIVRTVSVGFGKTIAEADAIAAITKAWGTPTKATVSNKETLIWVNPEAKLRAKFNKQFKALWIEAYMPLEDFLGAGDTLGFEKPLKVIGASKAAIAKAYGASYKLSRIHLPALKFGASTGVRLVYRGDTVERMKVWIPYGPAKDQVMAALEARFGKPELVKATNGYEKDRQLLGGKIEITDQKDKFYLEFTAPKPAK